MERLLASICFLSVVFACGAPSSDIVGGTAGQGLVVSPDASVSTATYTIAGPNGFSSAGTVPVGESPDVAVVLSHLPVGQGYELDLSATASDGVTSCEGTTNFDVTDSVATLTLVVHLTCAKPTGDVSVQATLNLCPVMDGFDAAPLDLALGGVASLSVTAHDTDNQPAALAYSWVVNGLKLPRQSAPTLSFVCSSVGQVTIVAKVSDGDPDQGCAATSDAKVSCQ